MIGESNKNGKPAEKDVPIRVDRQKRESRVWEKENCIIIDREKRASAAKAKKGKSVMYDQRIGYTVGKRTEIEKREREIYICMSNNTKG